MKKRQSYGILLLALLVCSSVSAKVDHFVGANAQVGEWSLFPFPLKGEYTTSAGLGGNLGFQYELQHGRKYSPLRLLFDVGVGATGGITAFGGGGNMKEVVPSHDLQGQAFDYVYEIRNRRDVYINLAVTMPVMLGLQYKRFYAMAGLKVYANMVTNASCTANLTTYGLYDGWDEFRNMPEYQFFDNELFISSIMTKLNMDVDFSLEIGGRLGVINYAVGYDVPRRKIEYRLAGFVDVGLLDVHTRDSKPSLVLPPYNSDRSSNYYVYNSRSMIKRLKMNDIMSTKNFASEVRNLMVGLKFTVLFQLPSQQKCVMCADGYQSTVRSFGRGGRRMKYEE